MGRQGRGAGGRGDQAAPSPQGGTAAATRGALTWQHHRDTRGACGACGACGARSTTQEMMEAVKAKKLAKSCNDTTTGV